ncbi:CLUMA_CG007888, isoform A [Clunio marinus]|uniref:CLUMA_CG007888, isoform A n=1 Tax=Clunio marinus TaxID=568069 RepID=A0A1J1I2E0_9DIPT|nr:CLUMA_CG007888, isoform A [Clunio marinus]
MGCITSKTVISENPNRFDVIFADTEQTIYYNAQLEINGSDIILYRKNKPPLSWPLGSLRRYGFDANFFTFESGRRCETGEGIFSFKCQRADVLFNTLQSYINGRAYNTDDTNLHDFAVPNALNRNIAQLNSLNMAGTLHTSTQGSSYIVNARPNSSLSPAGTNSLQSRSTDTLTADYLEPNPNRAINTHVARLSANMRLNSFGSGGPISPSSPGSPNSYTNILEITNLNPIPQQQSHGNIYQDYPTSTMNLQKPTKFSLDVAPQELAPVMNQLKVTKKDPSKNVYMNAEIGKKIKDSEVKPTLRATLAEMESLEVDPDVPSPDSVKGAAAVYMNVEIGDEKSVGTPPGFVEGVKDNQPPIVTTPPVLTNNLNSKMNDIKKDYTKNVGNGNIFGFSRASSFSQDPSRCYENLDISLSEMKTLMIRNRYSRPEIFSKVDLPLIDRTDKSEPCTPTQRKVNYIVLDLDQPQSTIMNNNNNNFNDINLSSSGNNNGSENNFNDTQSHMVTSTSIQNSLLAPESPKKLGYATIDFNRSTALSNILSNNPILDFDQSSRKTRHDSNVIPVVLTMKHSNSISD